MSDTEGRRLPEGWVLADSETPIEDIVSQCPSVFRCLKDRAGPRFPSSFRPRPPWTGPLSPRRSPSRTWGRRPAGSPVAFSILSAVANPVLLLPSTNGWYAQILHNAEAACLNTSLEGVPEPVDPIYRGLVHHRPLVHLRRRHPRQRRMVLFDPGDRSIFSRRVSRPELRI